MTKIAELKNNLPKQSSDKGGVVANIIFCLSIGFLTLTFINIILNFSKYKFLYACVTVFLSLGGIALFLLALRLKVKVKKKTAFILCYLMAVLWTIEATRPYKPLVSLPYVQPFFVDRKFPKLADRRSGLEFINDYQKKNIIIYPGIEPSDFFGDSSEIFHMGEKTVFPLGNISDSKILSDKASGEWQYFISDEHGFNNPKGLYAPGKADIVILGPSFAQGYGVKQDENFAGVLREKYPRTLTLGLGGSGPLAQFAIFREYAEPLKPKIVLWFYYEGSSIGILDSELGRPPLNAYLNPGYKQNLFDHAFELDQMLKIWLKQKKVEQKKTDQIPWTEQKERIAMTLKLERIRNLLGLQFGKGSAPYSPPLGVAYYLPSPPHIMYLKLLNFVNERLKSWGGRLYVIAIPTTMRVQEGVRNPKYNYSFYRDGQLAGVEWMKIPLIDLYPVILSHPDPMSLYPYRSPGHYTKEGYRYLAEFIRKELDKEFKGTQS